MTSDRWRRINDLFHEAVDRDASGRQRLLERAADGDPELAAEVRSLLAAHDSAGGLLEQPAWTVAPELVLDPDGPLRADAEAGPYRIVREIGRGGMGVVYEAEDTRLRRAVALKALPAEYAADPVRRERLTREARAAAALAHPNIATIFALDELEGSLFLVSELVRGRTLREELREGPLPADRLYRTLVELASGLAAAHAAGIVHRDFKPENIVRCDDGRVKILDFGLARVHGDDAPTELRLTQSGMAVGTPGYMAPEQLGGLDVDARTDVFAFGVVAWELATGAHPFGASAAELLARVADLMDGRPVGTSAGSLPIHGLEPILRRCLRRSAGERYPSARELLPALEALGRQAPGVPGASSAEDGRAAAVWWWQVHQGAMAAVVASMPVACWFLRQWDRSIGPRLFLAALALATVSVTIRLNLLFTARVSRGHLLVHYARVFRGLAVVEALLGLLLLASAALVAGPLDALAAILVTLAVAMLASLTIVEPATTRAAFGGKVEGDG